MPKKFAPDFDDPINASGIVAPTELGAGFQPGGTAQNETKKQSQRFDNAIEGDASESSIGLNADGKSGKNFDVDEDKIKKAKKAFE